jgi:hypothetical protein
MNDTGHKLSMAINQNWSKCNVDSDKETENN